MGVLGEAFRRMGGGGGGGREADVVRFEHSGLPVAEQVALTRTLTLS